MAITHNSGTYKTEITTAPTDGSTEQYYYTPGENGAEGQVYHRNWKADEWTEGNVLKTTDGYTKWENGTVYDPTKKYYKVGNDGKTNYEYTFNAGHWEDPTKVTATDENYGKAFADGYDPTTGLYKGTHLLTHDARGYSYTNETSDPEKQNTGLFTTGTNGKPVLAGNITNMVSTAAKARQQRRLRSAQYHDDRAAGMSITEANKARHERWLSDQNKIFGTFNNGSDRNAKTTGTWVKGRNLLWNKNHSNANTPETTTEVVQNGTTGTAGTTTTSSTAAPYVKKNPYQAAFKQGGQLNQNSMNILKTNYANFFKSGGVVKADKGAKTTSLKKNYIDVNHDPSDGKDKTPEEYANLWDYLGIGEVNNSGDATQDTAARIMYLLQDPTTPQYIKDFFANYIEGAIYSRWSPRYSNFAAAFNNNLPYSDTMFVDPSSITSNLEFVPGVGAVQRSNKKDTDNGIPND